MPERAPTDVVGSAEASGKGRGAYAPLVIGLLLTLLWFASGAYYVATRFSMLSELPPNSLGDFLAGSFAPLAFLWLVIAVFLQKNELRLQREELIQNRNALLLQAKELGASVEQLTLQAKIMKEEQDRQVSLLEGPGFEAEVRRLGLTFYEIAEATVDWTFKPRSTTHTEDAIALQPFVLSQKATKHLLNALHEGTIVSIADGIVKSLGELEDRLTSSDNLLVCQQAGNTAGIEALEQFAAEVEELWISARHAKTPAPLIYWHRLQFFEILRLSRSCVEQTQKRLVE